MDYHKLWYEHEAWQTCPWEANRSEAE